MAPNSWTPGGKDLAPTSLRKWGFTRVRGSIRAAFEKLPELPSPGKGLGLGDAHVPLARTQSGDAENVTELSVRGGKGTVRYPDSPPLPRPSTNPWAPEGEDAVSAQPGLARGFLSVSCFSTRCAHLNLNVFASSRHKVRCTISICCLLGFFFHYVGKCVQEPLSAKPGSLERHENLLPGQENAYKIASCHFSADKWVRKCTACKGGRPWRGVLCTHQGTRRPGLLSPTKPSAFPWD